MAVVFTYDLPKPVRLEKGNKAGLAIISGTIAFDSSYPTGGESISDLTSKFASCLRVICEGNGGYTFQYDKTNAKLKALVPVDVVAGSGTAGVNNYIFKSATATLEVDGTGTAFQVPGAEVADTTDLSGLTAVSFIALGLM